MNDTDINAFNLKIRQTDWYQNYFRQRGLDPNNVKLNDQQRKELKSLVEQNSGFVLPGDMKIDPAGNLNEKGGWAGLPVGVKIAIIGGLTVATAGALGAFSGAAGAGSAAGGGGAAAGSGAATGTAIGTGMGIAPSLAGSTAALGGSMAGGLGAGAAAGGAAAAGGSGLMSTIARGLASPLASAAGRMLSGAGQAAASNRGTELEARLAHDQLQLAGNRDRRDAETDTYRKTLYGQLAAGYDAGQRPAGAEGRFTEGFITPQAREAGQLMYDQAMKRMKEQNYGPGITPWDQLPTQPGTMERIAQYGAPALSLFDPRTYQR